MSSSSETTYLSRADGVRLSLFESIRSGKYKENEQLPSENALASQFGVSRPVVREAVSRLIAEGLVRAERGRGTFVADEQTTRQMRLLPITNINDLLCWQELRIAIEQEAARMAAERSSPEGLARIRTAYERLVEAAGKGDRAVELDFDFHVAIAEATENPILLEAQRSLGDHISKWMLTMHSMRSRPVSERLQYREREHAAILEAIERNDPEAASHAARRHNLNGRTRLLAELSETRG